MSNASAIPPNSDERQPRFRAALATGGIVWCAYLVTLAPSVSGGDSGELISAAYSFGVCHPPGYPLWNMLAKAWMTLLPFGEIAWRVNLFCATCTALAIFWLVYVAYEAGLSTLGAVSAGVFAGLSKAIWSQAVLAEKYPPALAAGALCFYCILRYENTRRLRYFYLTALTLGITAICHQTIVTFVPIMAALVLTRGGWRILKPKRLVLAGFLAAVPLSLYLYVMFCAKTNPPINWGMPDSLSRLYHHVMRHQYPSEFTKNHRSLSLFLLQFGSLVDIGLHEFTPFLWALVPAGLVSLWRIAGARKFAFIAAIALAGTAGFILELSPPLERETLQSIHVFFMNGWMAVAVILGAAVEYVQWMILPSRNGALFRRMISAGLCALCVGVLVVRNLPQASMRGNYLPHDYARNILKTVAPNAVIFPGGDHNTFPLLYCMVVEHERPDVTVADKYGYIEKSMYQHMPGTFPEIPNESQRLEILKWILCNETRPIYFTEPPNLPNVRLRQEGLVFRVIGEADPKIAMNLWTKYNWHNIRNDEWSRPTNDYGSQMVISDYSMMRARYLLITGDRKKGEQMLTRSAEYGWGVKELMNNLGSMAAEEGLLSLAEDLFNRAIDIDPNYVTPRRNLDTIHAQQRHSAISQELVPPELPSPNPMDLLQQDAPGQPGQFMPPGIPDPEANLPQ